MLENSVLSEYLGREVKTIKFVIRRKGDLLHPYPSSIQLIFQQAFYSFSRTIKAPTATPVTSTKVPADSS